jgi:hypothetical protein
MIHGQLKLLQFGSSFYSDTFDPLRRKFFFLPVRWHARPLNANWSVIEKRAAKTLLKSVAPSGKAANSLLFALRTMTWVMRLLVTAIEKRNKTKGWVNAYYLLTSDGVRLGERFSQPRG